MTISTQCRAFYVPGASSIVDFERAAGSGIAECSGETLEQLQMRHPGAILGDLDTFVSDKEARYAARPVVEITAEQWHDALEVLPPARWGRSDGIESFQMCELHDGRTTYTYVRAAGRYFEFLAVMGTPRAELAARVAPLAEQRGRDWNAAHGMADANY